MKLPWDKRFWRNYMSISKRLKLILSLGLWLNIRNFLMLKKLYSKNPKIRQQPMLHHIILGYSKLIWLLLQFYCSTHWGSSDYCHPSSIWDLWHCESSSCGYISFIDTLTIFVIALNKLFYIYIREIQEKGGKYLWQTPCASSSKQNKFENYLGWDKRIR